MADFAGLVLDMKSKGAFASSISPGYGRGATKLTSRACDDIPQDEIQINRHAIIRNLNLYMPFETVLTHVRDFINDPAWTYETNIYKYVPRTIVSDLPYDDYLPDPLTLHLDHPLRREAFTKFTRSEHDIFLKMMAQHPAILWAFSGYQLAHINYLTRLHKAIFDCEDLTGEERSTGLNVVANLLGPWMSDNFYRIIGPSICLHLALRRQDDPQAQPSEADFTQGMRFAFTNEAFEASLMNASGDARHFKCPAKHFIAVSTGQELTGRLRSDTKVSGTGIFCIYQRIKNDLDPSLVRSLRRAIAKARFENNSPDLTNLERAAHVAFVFVIDPINRGIETVNRLGSSLSKKRFDPS